MVIVEKQHGIMFIKVAPLKSFKNIPWKAVKPRDLKVWGGKKKWSLKTFQHLLAFVPKAS
jgi:hypothetical protein